MTKPFMHPFIFGLTGSIGMGKSAVAAMFRELGVPVFDADEAVHALQGPDGALLPMIEAAFPGTTGPRGVDRIKLGAAVFGDPAMLKRLEAIVHPAVGAMRAGFLEENAGKSLIVFDIPLLFEKGGFDMVDEVARRLRSRRHAARPRARPAGHDGGEIRADPETPGARRGEAGAGGSCHRYRRIARRNPCRGGTVGG